MNEEIVVELVQTKMTLKNTKTEVEKLLFDEKYREKIKTDYQRLKKLIGGPGCSQRAAKKMVGLLE